MITVYFVRNGSKIRVEVPVNTTLMEAAKFYANPAIEEIPATCGGCCACATCHIHLDYKWQEKLGHIDYQTPEVNLLEYEKKYKEGVSRLACQIELKPEHDGLIAHLLSDELL